MQLIHEALCAGVAGDIAAPVSFTVELHPEGADIGSLERAVSAGLEVTARRLWQELLETLDRLVPAPAATSAVVACCGPTDGPGGAS